MKNGIQKPTLRIAVCSIISALCVVLMMITTLIPIGTYALPCFAGILIIAVVIEYGIKWALGVFAVVALLSVFLAGDKEAVLYFIALFGYYPILKAFLESKLKSKLVQYLIKLAIFNIAAVGSFYIATLILSISLEEFTLFGVYVPWVFLIVGNIFFVIYDLAISVFVTAYVQKLRDKLFGRIK